MFSGIKSIIFGYSEAENSTSGNNESALSINSSKSADTSALLEQTLNAATTKFTEQLLPQSPSIEQLQSSSHQLLPTLTEQHEEDIFKKQRQIEEAEKPTDDDDDGCFNADSWELLDLVEKPEANSGSLISTVQDDSVNKAGGILKQKSNKNNNNDQDGQAAKQQQQQKRQKQKVSFEAPDLVKGKQKIETTTPKDKLNSGKATKNNNKKRNKQAKAIASDNNAIAPATSASTEEAVEIEKPDENVDIEPELEMPNWQQQQLVVKKAVPVLNYAAALATKLKSDEAKVDEVGGSKSLTPQTKIPMVAANQSGLVNLKASGAVKRNRPVSSSSWSSSDEIETIDSIWNDIHCESQVGHEAYEEATFEEAPKAGVSSKGLKQKKQQSAKKEVKLSSGKTANSTSAVKNSRQADDDEESIISSGFSDCDYGYEGLNDYIMRPKKAQNKRRGISANSNSLLTSMSRRGKEEQQQFSAVEETVGSRQEPSKFSKGKASTSMKHIKPKKKKMTFSAMSSSNSSDYLKKRCLSNVNREPNSSSSFVLEESEIIESDLLSEQKQQEFVKTEATETAASCSPAHLMPPPPAPMQSMATSSTSGNDSSDVPEMDESWYVTPPSCFTGSNKLIQKTRPSKAKEAARENALIEHPSIYIASTSKTQNIRKQVATSSKLPVAEPSVAKPTRAFVLRKVSKQSSGGKNAGSNISSSSSEFEMTKNKSSSSSYYFASAANAASRTERATQAPGEKKKSAAKAWENKFIVTNWNCDEQDDINDFDNLFEADESTQSTPKVKKSKPKIKQRKSANLVRLDSPSFFDVSAGYESDEFSIPASVVGLSADLPSDLSSVEMVEQQSGSGSPIDTSTGDENLEPSVNDNDGDFIDDLSLEQQSEKPLAERRAPIQVRPIEPERQPGWQLRRKRSRRRPLSTSMANTCNAAAGIGSGSNGKRRSLANSKSLSSIDGCSARQMSAATASSAGSNPGSQATSARSSPTLIDRIGSSIVANLTNLTNGAFPGATAVGMSPIQVAQRAAIEEAERLNQTVARKSSGEFNLIARRRLSKAYLDRQNDCSRLSKSNRRADRRLKMHSTPNGSSVNRKVQTNFH